MTCEVVCVRAGHRNLRSVDVPEGENPRDVKGIRCRVCGSRAYLQPFVTKAAG